MAKTADYIDKPIALMMDGLSLRQFKYYAHKLIDKNWYWMSLNRWRFFTEDLGIKLDALVAYPPAYHDTDFTGAVLKIPDIHRPVDVRESSLHCFLLDCIDVGVKDVIMFGADGYSDGDEAYIDQEVRKSEFEGRSQPSLHKENCQYTNDTFPLDTRLNVINVSENSHYHIFKNITYNRAIENLPI